MTIGNMDVVRSRTKTGASPARRRFLAGITGAGAALCLNGCAWLADKQRKLVYRPTPGSIEAWVPIGPRDESLWLTQRIDRDETQGVRALWIPQADPTAPAVLYLHGTFRHMVQNRPKILPIWQAGYSVLAVDYRGWGESEAIVPSEASIMADAELAWQEFTWRVREPARRVLYGHSMGTGVAVELARRHQDDGPGPGPALGALVLESAFTSLPGIAEDYGGIGHLAAAITTEEFRSLDKIGSIRVPKWFMAGSADRTVPPVHSQRLYEAASEPRHLVPFEGGNHSRMQESDPARYRAVWDEVRQTLRLRAEAEAEGAKPTRASTDRAGATIGASQRTGARPPSR